MNHNQQQQPHRYPRILHVLALALVLSPLAVATVKAQGDDGQKREPLSGEEVYNRFCGICHKAGMNAAPRFGSEQAWAPVKAKGRETVYRNAIEGINAMPPKGGISGLYDQEVKDAVDYMIDAVGGWPGNN